MGSGEVAARDNRDTAAEVPVADQLARGVVGVYRGVVEKRRCFENEPIAVYDRLAENVHLDPDSRQGAALGKMKIVQVLLEKIELSGVARPKGEGEKHLRAIVRPHHENLSVLAGPKLFRRHVSKLSF